MGNLGVDRRMTLEWMLQEMCEYGGVSLRQFPSVCIMIWCFILQKMWCMFDLFIYFYVLRGNYCHLSLKEILFPVISSKNGCELLIFQKLEVCCLIAGTCETRWRCHSGRYHGGAEQWWYWFECDKTYCPSFWKEDKNIDSSPACRFGSQVKLHHLRSDSNTKM